MKGMHEGTVAFQHRLSVGHGLDIWCLLFEFTTMKIFLYLKSRSAGENENNRCSGWLFSCVSSIHYISRQYVERMEHKTLLEIDVGCSTLLWQYRQRAETHLLPCVASSTHDKQWLPDNNVLKMQHVLSKLKEKLEAMHQRKAKRWKRVWSSLIKSRTYG